MTADFHHRDGLHWYQAPIPPTQHECSTWSSGWIGLTEYSRCACGGVERNRSGHWMDRNSRHEENTVPDTQVPKHAVDAVLEVLVAVKSEAGLRASWLSHAALNRAARPIARLLVRLVDAAVDARLTDKDAAA